MFNFGEHIMNPKMQDEPVSLTGQTFKTFGVIPAYSVCQQNEKMAPASKEFLQHVYLDTKNHMVFVDKGADDTKVWLGFGRAVGDSFCDKVFGLLREFSLPVALSDEQTHCIIQKLNSNFHFNLTGDLLEGDSFKLTLDVGDRFPQHMSIESTKDSLKITAPSFEDYEKVCESLGVLNINEAFYQGERQDSMLAYLRRP
jgi:hypothetical protein